MKIENPKKNDYRPRAHVNPYSDHEMFIPKNPKNIDWSEMFDNNNSPKYVDIGCGYGKFLLNLSKTTEKNVLGIEIREKIVEYVNKLIEYQKHTKEIKGNVKCIKTNALFFLPNIFDKQSLNKIFILFPDPQFKMRKRKTRILTTEMLKIYDFILEKEGRIYFSTDVEEYFNYAKEIFDGSDIFKEIKEDELLVKIKQGTNESERAGKKTGKTFGCVYEKIR